MKYALRQLRIPGLLLCLALAGPVMALQVTGLYDYRVAVADESQTERQRAFQEALRAVILKVTGDERWLDHPSVQRAINNAQSYVEAISFSSEQIPVEADAANAGSTEEIAEDTDSASPATDEPEKPAVVQPQFREQRYINVEFADNLINDLLAAADIPIWDSNRPSVLVWMAIQEPSGERSMLTADTYPEIMALMQEFGERRGLPVIFPVLDFEDRRSLGVDQVWTLEEEAIRTASNRYGADSVLAGRILRTASEELVGLWQFQFQGQSEVFDGFASELEDYLFGPLNRITNQLAGYFAIAPEDAPRTAVNLRVDGVGDLRDYSALIAYLGNLGAVESVLTTGLEGERIELRVGVLGNAQQLNEQIALDRDLLPIQSGMSQTDQLLHYRWTR